MASPLDLIQRMERVGSEHVVAGCPPAYIDGVADGRDQTSSWWADAEPENPAEVPLSPRLATEAQDWWQALPAGAADSEPAVPVGPEEPGSSEWWAATAHALEVPDLPEDSTASSVVLRPESPAEDVDTGDEASATRPLTSAGLTAAEPATVVTALLADGSASTAPGSVLGRSGSVLLTRVTVDGGSRCCDLSVPADVPLAGLLPALLELLEVQPTAHPRAWALVRLDKSLDLEASLAEAGVVDGEVLYLQPDGDQFEPVVVQDALATVRESAAAHGPRWTGHVRERSLCWLALAPAAGAGLLVGTAPKEAALLAAVLLVVVAAAVLRRVRRVAPVWLPGLAVAASAGAGWSVAASAGSPARALWALFGATAGLVVLGVGGRRSAAALAAAPALFAVLMTAGALSRGWPLPTALSVPLLPLLLSVALTPRVAAATHRLPELVRRQESGEEEVTRDSAVNAATAASASVAAGVASAAACALCLCSALVLVGDTPDAALGLGAAAVFALLARGYSSGYAVLPLLCVLVGTLVVTLVKAASTAAQTWVLALALLALLVTACGLTVLGRAGLGRVPAARVSRLLDAAEVVLVLVLAPALLLSQGALQSLYNWAS